MKCFSCGKNFPKLNEVVDGRRTIHLCDMCKAEREWKHSSEVIPFPTKKSLFERFTQWLRKLLGIR